MKRIILYGLVSLIVLGPLLGRGYILTLDMVFTPELRLPEQLGSSYLFHAALHYVNVIVPADIIQKLLLLGIFITAGLGTHQLVSYIQKLRHHHTHRLLHRIAARFGAGIFYMINPFTYERLMAGHYAVLMGYALLPWFTRFLLTYLYRPSWITAAKATFIALVISVVSIHTLGAIVLLTAVGIAGAYVQYGWRTIWKLYSRQLITSVLTFFILCSYWLMPLLFGTSQAAQQINRFGEGDRVAFATTGSNFLEQMINVLQLRGFWAERYELFTLPWAKLGLTWYLLSTCVIALVIAGLVCLWRNNRSAISIFFILVMVAGVLCASGLLFSPGLAEYGLLSGFREPHKFTMLIALTYSIGFGFGLANLLHYWGQTFTSLPSQAAAAATIIAIPLIWTMVMLWGANGQLAPRNYPKDWLAVNQALNQQPVERAVFLPWHLYMHMDFAGRTIANPAPNFFDKPVIVSDDPELQGASMDKPSALSRSVNKLLDDPPNNLAQRLKQLGISHIILAKEHDYREYLPMVKQSGMKPIIETDTIALYRLQTEQELIHAPSR